MRRRIGSGLLLVLLWLAPGSGLGAAPDAFADAPAGTATTVERPVVESGRPVLSPAGPKPSVSRNDRPEDPTGVRNRLFRQRQHKRLHQHGEEGNSAEGQQRRYRL